MSRPWGGGLGFHVFGDEGLSLMATKRVRQDVCVLVLGLVSEISPLISVF